MPGHEYHHTGRFSEDTPFEWMDWPVRLPRVTEWQELCGCGGIYYYLPLKGS